LVRTRLESNIASHSFDSSLGCAKELSHLHSVLNRSRVPTRAWWFAVSRIESPGLDQACRSGRPNGPRHEWYDPSMTRAKIAISLPKDQLVRVHREVRAGRADSVSGYIARVLAEHERRESLRALLRDLVDQYGKPAAEDVRWAQRALAPRRG